MSYRVWRRPSQAMEHYQLRSPFYSPAYRGHRTRRALKRLQGHGPPDDRDPWTRQSRNASGFPMPNSRNIQVHRRLADDPVDNVPAPYAQERRIQSPAEREIQHVFSEILVVLSAKGRSPHHEVRRHHDFILYERDFSDLLGRQNLRGDTVDVFLNLVCELSPHRIVSLGTKFMRRLLIDENTRIPERCLTSEYVFIPVKLDDDHASPWSLFVVDVVTRGLCYYNPASDDSELFVERMNLAVHAFSPPPPPRDTWFFHTFTHEFPVCEVEDTAVYVCNTAERLSNTADSCERMANLYRLQIAEALIKGELLPGDQRETSISMLQSSVQFRLMNLPHLAGQKSVNVCGVTVSAAEILRLSSKKWLGDDVIHGYLRLIEENNAVNYAFEPGRYRRISTVAPSVMSALNEVTINEQDVHDGDVHDPNAADFIRVLLPDPTGGDLILMPFCTNEHWILVVVDMKKRRIIVYDSKWAQKSSIQLTVKLLWALPALQGFDMIRIVDIPKQANGDDCGAYVCMFARYIAERRPLDEKTFTDYEMSMIRQRIVHELGECRLLEIPFEVDPATLGNYARDNIGQDNHGNTIDMP